MQVKTGLPWWLVCDDRLLKFNPVPRLLGREFNHGVQDCYSIIRDAYHLCGISLDDFERHDNWWYTGDNLYLDNIPRQGFIRLMKYGMATLFLSARYIKTLSCSAIYR